MQFESTVRRVEAEPVTLAGAELMVVATEHKAHVVPRDVFELFFAPVMAVVEVGVRIDVSDAESVLASLERNTRLGVARKQRISEIKSIDPLKAIKCTTSDLSAYPEAIRFALASSQRQVWDALDAPRTLDEIQEWTAMTNQSAYRCLAAMRDKTLVHKRDSDGKWERVTEVAR